VSARQTFAFIAGSGLGAVADGFDVEERVPFETIPGVGCATVPGHRGEVLRCRSAGATCWVVMGRRHIYEGDATPIRALVSWLAERGATDLVVTSAAGSLRTTLSPGDLVLVTGVLDLQSQHVATGVATAPDRGLRRRNVDTGLSRRIVEAAGRAGVALHSGIVACLDGPTYETPAEVAFLQTAGADFATMSAAPEIAAAAETGLRVACIGAITNPGTGIGNASPGHTEVLSAASAMAPVLGRIFLELVAN
jgi:purine-nucleoside phosphorylase